MHQQLGVPRETRNAILAFLPCLSGPLSILGSSLILTRIYKLYCSSGQGRGGQHLTTYHRIMLGISISDIIFSIAFSIGPLAMPVDGARVPGAMGNRQTCSAQGFFILVGFASCAYSHMLMLYFCLVIRYNVSPYVMTSRIEPFMHAIPITVYFGSAGVGLFMEAFNPSRTFCWVTPYPPNCERQWSHTPCERGVEYYEVYYKNFVLPLYVLWVALIVFWLGLVVFTVIQKVRKSRAFQFQTAVSQGAGNRSGDGVVVVSSSRRAITQQRTPSSNNLSSMQQDVILQSVLYATWFLLVMVFLVVITVTEQSDLSYKTEATETVSYAGVAALLPMQGFVNFLIYIRPTYKSIRRYNPDLGRWKAFHQACFGKVNSPLSSSSSQESNNRQSQHNRTNAAANTSNIFHVECEEDPPACEKVVELDDASEASHASVEVSV